MMIGLKHWVVALLTLGFSEGNTMLQMDDGGTKKKLEFPSGGQTKAAQIV